MFVPTIPYPPVAEAQMPPIASATLSRPPALKAVKPGCGTVGRKGPTSIAWMTIAGWEAPSAENREDTATFVSMTAYNLAPPCIPGLLDFRVDFVKCHFRDTGPGDIGTHGGKGVRGFLPLLDFAFRTDLEGYPPFADDQVARPSGEERL